MEALLAGKSIVDAATVARVDRTTIHRWFRDDAAFIAEYQTDRAEMVGRIRRELAALGQDAVETLRESLAQGAPPELRLRAALALLKMLGADYPVECGDTTVREAAAAVREREGDLVKRELIASLTDAIGKP
jgi:hypothetical protein